MDGEESVYTELADLKLGMEMMQLDDNQRRYNHLKHRAGKLLVGREETK